MRQQSHTTHAPAPTRARRTRTRREFSGITITPMRGFSIALLFLGVPTVTLGGLCFLLLQNNLKLSRTNNELSEIANEVKAEVDSLGDEIESLRERAGVPELKSVKKEDLTSKARPQPGRAGESTITSSNTIDISQNSLRELTPRSSSLGLTVRGGGGLAKSLSPKGGPENKANAFDLFADVKQQVPELNRALDSAVKPALEKALAEEAAYPDGQPVVGHVEVSSEYGIRSNPFSGSGYEVHEGMDFVGEHGDIIAAAGDGVVKLSGPNGGYGITVTIDHGYGYETLYAHMSANRVKVGDRIKRGQIIGYIGSTGRSSGPHLHYSLYKNDKSINPRTLLKLPENRMATGPR